MNTAKKMVRTMKNDIALLKSEDFSYSGSVKAPKETSFPDYKEKEKDIPAPIEKKEDDSTIKKDHKKEYKKSERREGVNPEAIEEFKKELADTKEMLQELLGKVESLEKIHLKEKKKEIEKEVMREDPLITKKEKGSLGVLAEKEEKEPKETKNKEFSIREDFEEKDNILQEEEPEEEPLKKNKEEEAAKEDSMQKEVSRMLSEEDSNKKQMTKRQRKDSEVRELIKELEERFGEREKKSPEKDELEEESISKKAVGIKLNEEGKGKSASDVDLPEMKEGSAESLTEEVSFDDLQIFKNIDKRPDILEKISFLENFTEKFNIEAQVMTDVIDALRDGLVSSEEFIIWLEGGKDEPERETVENLKKAIGVLQKVKEGNVSKVKRSLIREMEKSIIYRKEF